MTLEIRNRAARSNLSCHWSTRPSGAGFLAPIRSESTDASVRSARNASSSFSSANFHSLADIGILECPVANYWLKAILGLSWRFISGTEAQTPRHRQWSRRTCRTYRKFYRRIIISERFRDQRRLRQHRRQEVSCEDLRFYFLSGTT